MPNLLAYFALLIWPVVAVVLYRRMPVERAVVWSILLPYLFLPPLVRFDFPGVPPLDKTVIPLLSAYAICVLMLGRKVPILPVSPMGRLLTLMYLLLPVGSVLANGDPIPFAIGGGVPGLRVYDAVATGLSQGISLIPFLLARRFLGTETARREILVALVIAGLVYSVPMLIEIRMSPQINVWVYGFFQHDFIQMVRQGGYRPIVFLPHGLWVAFFVLMTLVAAVALWRAGQGRERGRYLAASGYLWMMLVLCKSAAALIYSIVLVPLTGFAGRRTQLRFAALLALIATSYPLLREARIIPIETMLTQAGAASMDRAASLAFRFQNEEELLAHARERPWLGWGPWGRNQVYDPVSGEMLSTTDGRWIITIGTFGWGGYLAEFGLLALPLLALAARSFGSRERMTSPTAGPLALILGFNLIDMLPNATLIPFTWLLAGALLGHGERLAAGTGEEGAAPMVAAGPPPVRSVL